MTIDQQLLCNPQQLGVSDIRYVHLNVRAQRALSHLSIPFILAIERMFSLFCCPYNPLYSVHHKYACDNHRSSAPNDVPKASLFLALYNLGSPWTMVSSSTHSIVWSFLDFTRILKSWWPMGLYQCPPLRQTPLNFVWNAVIGFKLSCPIMPSADRDFSYLGMSVLQQVKICLKMMVFKQS